MGFWREYGSELWRWWLLLFCSAALGAMSLYQLIANDASNPWLWTGAALFLQSATVLAAHSFWKKAQDSRPSRFLGRARHWLEELREEGTDITCLLALNENAHLFMQSGRVIKWRLQCADALGLIRGEPAQARFSRACDRYTRPEQLANPDGAVMRSNECRGVIQAGLPLIIEEIESIDVSKIRPEWDGERPNQST
jgi:hypothetical protein